MTLAPVPYYLQVAAKFAAFRLAFWWMRSLRSTQSCPNHLRAPNQKAYRAGFLKECFFFRSVHRGWNVGPVSVPKRGPQYHPNLKCSLKIHVLRLRHPRHFQNFFSKWYGSGIHSPESTDIPGDSDTDQLINLEACNYQFSRIINQPEHHSLFSSKIEGFTIHIYICFKVRILYIEVPQYITSGFNYILGLIKKINIIRILNP